MHNDGISHMSSQTLPSGRPMGVAGGGTGAKSAQMYSRNSSREDLLSAASYSHRYVTSGSGFNPVYSWCTYYR